ncbi:DUF262 domain-containing protein [Aquibacillus albus]|uniref:Uncharacterized protein with ParB-like and HNH nuclease domain n=1 Tax=Aquibacillus albus TaxID=1168171 RepID=A0ABS2N495_9BACI|nr:DUF262 domain-containing protein [Aquibacillus albus]MBM7572926.1 uncharacterized protein with ParB-like and HNH nuclease domain [Aquibacillus albus]
MDNNLKIIPVSSIFTNISYVIPIYQRNYAWGEVQIEQLIEDIDSSINDPNKNYFLGNLIVNQTDNNVYEVIDGQQRLTTLFLLANYLGMKIAKDALRFEAREKSNRTLKMINDNNAELLEELVSGEILEGYQIIENYFKTNDIVENELISKLEKVFLIRTQVPQDIDLNHYFEIMNTRGEQLELHEIAKAKFLEVLDTEHDKKTAALIWDKCSDMDSYIQMNFDSKVRKDLFTNDWTSIKESIRDFDSIRECVPNGEDDKNSVPLIEILKEKKLLNNRVSKDEIENERFESTISFTNFLLQVNAVIDKLGEEDSTLDDKHFLNNLSWAWRDADKAKNFLYHILKCRVLFDKYILKREYARDYKETGKWSLQRLEKYRDAKSDKPKYVGTFGDDDSKNNKQLRTLQSCLRITYTAPKTMHWISLVLTNLLENESCDIIKILEDYCKSKVIQSGFENTSGFGFERIVFTYLDYLLYKDGYSYLGRRIIPPMRDDWQFQFRSSIEHFQPQNPFEDVNWESDDLNGFGNLALITVSGNSKFSNLPPEGKISSYPSIIEQSLKLKIMKELVTLDDPKWTEEKANKHKEEMFRILKG